MTEATQINAKLENNRAKFNNELLMYINKRLYDKKIISEDMYFAAKEMLIKRAC